MKRILCATDLLAKSEAAIDRAALIANDVGADLSLLHVVVPMNSELDLEQTLRSAIQNMKSRSRPPRWRAGPAPNVIVRAGQPSRVILDTVKEHKIRLLVMGPHRKGSLHDTLEGTVAARVLASRRCPVLFAQGSSRSPYRNVLLALDLSSVSAAAVRAADGLAITRTAEVSVVHAYEPPYQGMLQHAGVGVGAIVACAEGWKREADTAVRDFLKWQNAGFTRYEVMIEEGHAAAAILRTARRVQPDLLVMGTRGRGRARRALLGSVANEVLHQIECDVLVVPHGSFDGDTRNKMPSTRARGARAESRVIS
ncbi:MAG: universal stress protein [Gammaproteobacteria bacterium]